MKNTNYPKNDARIRRPHITQHKRFVPYGTHLNFLIAKTSFKLESLSRLTRLNPEREKAHHLCLQLSKTMEGFNNER